MIVDGLQNVGYSKHFIQHADRMCKENKNNVRDQPVTYIKIPFVNEKQRRKILGLRRSTNNQRKIRVIFQTELPLGVSLRPAKECLACPRNCRACASASFPNCCNKKSCIYKITCQQCQKCYIGQTKRTMRSRIYEHLTSNDSAVFQHKQTHPGLVDFKWKIIRTIKDNCARVAAESIFIRKEANLMNGCEGRGILSFSS